MNDKELQRLAREYAEQNPPQGFKNLEALTMLDAASFEKFLRWLTKTHCIVSREQVMEQYIKTEKWLNETDKPKQHHDPIRLVAVGIQDTLESIFGKSTFEERSEK